AFDLANAVKVIANGAAVFRTDFALELRDLCLECIKDAAVLFGSRSLSEQPLECAPGIDLDWQWGGRRAPRHGIHVNAAIIAVAGTNHAGAILGSKFQGRQKR